MYVYLFTVMFTMLIFFLSNEMYVYIYISMYALKCMEVSLVFVGMFFDRHSRPLSLSLSEDNIVEQW